MKEELDEIFAEIESELRIKCSPQQYASQLIKRYIDARFELIAECDKPKKVTPMCNDCYLANGWKRKDDGCHTAILATCIKCGECKSILDIRHYTKGCEK